MVARRSEVSPLRNLARAFIEIISRIMHQGARFLRKSISRWSRESTSFFVVLPAPESPR
jgi:hypothetical protein